jgi:hypothetical protein
MSEYQYFEFQAIDRPLTGEQQAVMRRISHKVDLSPVRAAFTYHAGSFNAEPAALLAQHFDAMIHLTGWGDKRLMFRFPAALLDLERVRAYVDPLGKRLTWSVRGEYALLDIHFLRDAGAGWVEAERWLPALAPLRADLLRGDFRVLYLAWLKSLTPDDAEDVTEEPPVPAGLRDLPPQLEAFLELFEVDPYLFDVSVQASEERRSTSGVSREVAGDGPGPWLPFGLSEADLRRAVEALPRYEADAYLLRVAWGEPLADVVLLRRLREIAVPPTVSQTPRRNTAQLLAAASEVRSRNQDQKARVVEVQRIAELEDLAAREEQAWAMVERLVSRHGARPYDEAVNLLLKMRDAAAYKGDLPAFEERVARLCLEAKNRRGLMTRLRAAQLCS